jgi:hypothetical protein
LEETRKKCTCLCEFFECRQKKLISKQSSSSQSGIVCSWVGDPCKGYACAYSACRKGSLRQDGNCGLFERNVPVTTPFSSRGKQRQDADIDISTIANPKILKKLKWYETE